MQSPAWQKALKAAGVLVFRDNYARGIGRLCIDAKHPLLFKLDAGRGPEGVAMIKSTDKQTHYIRSRPYGPY